MGHRVLVSPLNDVLILSAYSNFSFLLTVKDRVNPNPFLGRLDTPVALSTPNNEIWDTWCTPAPLKRFPIVYLYILYQFSLLMVVFSWPDSI